MPAAKIFCPKTRGYVKIGIGSQYGLAKISFEIACYLQFRNSITELILDLVVARIAREIES